MRFAYLRKALSPSAPSRPSPVAAVVAPTGLRPPPPNVAPVLTTTTLAATEDTPFAGQLAATDAEGQAVTFARVH